MPDEMERLLAAYPVVIRFAPHWGEMDAYRHINNVAYFRWFESGRIAYFNRMGITDEGGQGLGPIMASTQCRYRAPLTHPDVVRVGTRCVPPASGGDRFTMEHALVSEKLGRLVAEGSCVIVAYDYPSATKRAVPEDWRARMLAIEHAAAAGSAPTIGAGQGPGR